MSILLTKYRLSWLVAAAILASFICDAQATFNFSINVPPDAAPTSLTGNQVLNLYEGGVLPAAFVVRDTSTLNFYGGIVGQFLSVTDSGTINVLGGVDDHPESGVIYGSQGTINFYEGSLGDQTYFDGTINIYGGDSGREALITGEVNWHGGLLRPDFIGFDEGTLNVYGRTFNIDGVPLNPLEIEFPFSVMQRGIEVSGTLESGEPFAFSLDAPLSSTLTPGFVSRGFATNLIFIVPEPNAFSLLAFAALGVSVRSRS